jgi:hypothetical protein
VRVTPGKETMNTHRYRRGLGLAAAASAALLLASCAAPASEGTGPTGEATSDTPTPRIALTYDGGLLVLDAETLDVEADLPIDGFTRVNPAGDGRHVLVTTAEGFQVLDMGTWTNADGTSQTAEPELTDLVFEADAAGHVVRHGEHTILYADGTGDTTIYETDALLENPEALPETEVVPAPEAHHGVSILLEDGTLLTTVGDSESRSGIRVLDADREEIAASDECPSVHGEGTAADEVAVFGCSDGALLYADGEITKLDAPDEYGRMGNAYTTESSPIVAGDYNADPDSEGLELTQLALIDTAEKSLDVVDLPEGVAYTWRGVARGPSDEILVLGTDGALHVLNETTGAVEESYPVIDAWEGPIEWQNPHPALTVLDGIAYVTEPASEAIHAVDIATGEVTVSGELPATPNEIAVAVG